MHLCLVVQCVLTNKDDDDDISHSITLYASKQDPIRLGGGGGLKAWKRYLVLFPPFRFSFIGTWTSAGFWLALVGDVSDTAVSLIADRQEVMIYDQR